MSAKKNGCRRCFSPCALCCDPLTKQCGLSCADAFDMELDGQQWKTSFGKASGLGKLCLGNPIAFTAVRGGLLCFWLAIMIWSMVDWVNSYAEPEMPNATSSSSGIACTTDALLCSDGKTYVSRSPPSCAFAPCPIPYGFGFWFTQLTHWTLLLELIYLGFAFATTALANFSKLPDGTGDDTPWFVSVTWALQPAALVGSFLLFVLYWALLYTPGSKLYAISIMTHGGNFVIMLIDVLICRQPLYMAHIYMPMAYALLYLLFSVIYYAAGGVNHQDLTSNYIYSVLDWSNPGGAGTLSALIVLLVIPFFYCVFLVLVFGRQRCSAAVDRTNKTSPV